MTKPPKSRTNDDNSTSPIVHALGGSIGSALALLLFYPLERARIEMQVAASAASETTTSNENTPSNRPILFDAKIDHSDEISDEESWASPAAVDSPSSWSMNSTPSRSQLQSPPPLLSTPRRSQHDNVDANDNKNGLFRCLSELHEQGVLYQGVTPIISTVFTSQFIFFFLHAYAKRSILRISSKSTSSSTLSSSPWSSLLSSCLAGIGNVLLTNPLWVTNMAIVSGGTKTQSLPQELIRLWKRHGAAYLWRGTATSMMLVSNPIIQWVCYEQLKRKLLISKMTSRHKKKSGMLGAAEVFVIAALAKATATISTYPLQLTQTLLRLNINNIKSKMIDADKFVDEEQNRKRQQRRQQYNGTLDCLIQLYRGNDAGVIAWFTGMRAKLLQTVLTAAFTFLTYEKILGVVHKLLTMRRRRQVEQ